MLRTLALSLTACLISFAHAAETKNFDDLFRQGLESYQTKAYDKARDAFVDALKLDPGNTAAMTNLALTSFQLNDKGTAIALFRRVLTSEPDQAQAREGLRFALSKLEIKEIPHRIETYETLRESVLQRAPARVFLGITAIFLLAGGWFLLSWLGTRRRALRADEVVPTFPLTTGFLLTFSVVGLVLTTMKLYDLSLPRGTIVGGSVEAKSAPETTGVALFTLHEGFEVLIRDVKEEWVQVTYPGGLTGWIPKKQLIAEQGAEG